MRPIIEQPHPDDEFYSPELIRFAAAGFCVVSALCAALGLWFVAAEGCFAGECGEGEDGWGFAALILFLWIAGQIVVGIAALAGFLQLIIYERTHKTAITFASAGILATVAMVGAAAIGLATGS